jgi:hypothetical protein
MYLVAAKSLLIHKHKCLVVKKLNGPLLTAAQTNFVNNGAEILEEKRKHLK